MNLNKVIEFNKAFIHWITVVNDPLNLWKESLNYKRLSFVKR